LERFKKDTSQLHLLLNAKVYMFCKNSKVYSTNDRVSVYFTVLHRLLKLCSTGLDMKGRW
jgi:hypothetical protein